MRLADAVVDILIDEGVDRVFGNPGTTELPLVDALSRTSRLPYVLAPHEGPVVAMADGFARATGRPAFVNLHVAAGTANGIIGMLNALRSRTPLVVVAGQQDSRHLIEDPMLSGDLVGLAQAATKWSVEARRSDEVPTLLRRAFRVAVTPPEGPVFLSVPMDYFGEPLSIGVTPKTALEPVRPVADLSTTVDLLWSAAAPVIVAGDGVGRSGGVAEMVRVAEVLGAPVYHAPMNDRLDFPMSHPSYRGMLPPENDEIRRVLDRHDAALLVGLRAFVPHHYNDTPAVGPGTRLVQIDDDPSLVGRNYPASVGLVGNVRLVLDSLAEALEASRPATRQERPPLPPRTVPEPTSDATPPFDPRLVAATVAESLPAGAVVVEEAITAGLLLREHLRLSEPGSFHHTVGGGLGWGAGAAVGVAMGRPGRRVVAALGDGCALFGLQALWTAAREQAAVTFVVFANGEYRTLKQTLTGMRAGRLGAFPGMDLSTPAVDWPALAGALGVPGISVADIDELGDAVASTGPSEGPLLVEVPTRSLAHDVGA